MSPTKYVLLAFVLTISTTYARKGFGPTEQDWGYVTVRDGAHMFWWLHQTTANVTNYAEKPLVIWLQGGPGASSTGYGNFAEIGPWDPDLNPRESAWTNNYNVLFVDNPVGTGFSYVDNAKVFTTNNRQIADDFLALMQGFYKAVPDLEQTPLYIFCESYGGKMNIEIALVLDQAIKAGKLNTKLLGVGLGDSWISPIDYVLTWGSYLFSVGAVDQTGLEAIDKVAKQTKDALDSGDYEGATDLWGMTEQVVLQQTGDIDFYNILTKISSGWQKSNGLIKPSFDDEEAKVDALMAGPVKKALGLNKVWGSQSGSVFSYLAGDFMKPVTDIVEEVLNTTDIRVAVYNGQLDLIVDTLGTVKWVDVLKFDGSSKWKASTRHVMSVDGIVEGYWKRVGNLAFYWVDRSGHMVPADNPKAMQFILDDVIGGKW